MLTRWLLLTAALLAADAFACECLPDEPGRIEKLYSASDAVVYGRVVGVGRAGEARLQVLEAFKGRVDVLRPKAGGGTACGTEFDVGDQEVFFVFRGEVNACGRRPASLELLERLRLLGR